MAGLADLAQKIWENSGAGNLVPKISEKSGAENLVPKISENLVPKIWKSWKILENLENTPKMRLQCT